MEALGVDVKLLLAQVVNFVLFFLVFKKFIATPFMKYLSTQREKEKERERLLLELQTKEQEMQEEQKKILKLANEKGTEIVAESKKLAEEMKAEILSAAHKESEELKKNLLAQMKTERESMYEDIKDYIVKTSATMTQRVLANFVDKNQQKEILTHLEKTLPKEI